MMQHYWNNRIQILKGLRATGHASFSEQVNAMMYTIKLGKLDAILNILQMNDRELFILDLGCGIGFFTKYYVNLGFKVIAIDIAKSAIRFNQARNFPNVHLILADASYLPLRNDMVQLVHEFDLSYHIVDNSLWKKHLKEVVRVLQNGGSLILTEKKGITLPRGSYHVRFRPLNHYNEILGRKGMELQLIDSIFLFFGTENPCLAFIIRSIYNAIPKLAFIIERSATKLPSAFKRTVIYVFRKGS